MRKQHDCLNLRCLHLSQYKNEYCCIWCARGEVHNSQRHTANCEQRYEVAGRPSMRIFSINNNR